MRSYLIERRNKEDEPMDIMTRRRMMMSGKPRPLFVFTPGAPLQNYSEIKRKSLGNTTWYEASSYIEYGTNNENVCFSPLPYSTTSRRIYRVAIPLKSGYTKLFVKAKSNSSGSTSEYFNAYICWSTAADGFFYDKTLLQDKEETFEFDISKRDKTGGVFYLFFQPSSWGGANLVVTDIHFE